MFQPNFVTFTSMDIVRRDPLEGAFKGNQNDGFWYVVFADGSGGVEKSLKDWIGNKTGRLYRAEILAAQEYLAARVGEVMNAPVRDARFTKDATTIVMPYIDGTPGDEKGDEALPDNPQGNALRLFDYLVANADRRPKNWISTSDGRIVGIDHALCNFRERVPSAELVTNLWNAGVTIESLMALHPKLNALAPEFHQLGMNHQFDTMMLNLNRLMAAFGILSQYAVINKYEDFTPRNPDAQNWGWLGEGEKDPDDTTSTIQEDLGIKKVPKPPMVKSIVPDTDVLAPKAVAMFNHALALRRKQQYESARFAHQDAAQMFRDAAEKHDGGAKELLLARAKEQDVLAQQANFADEVGENHSPSEMPADFQKGVVGYGAEEAVNSNEPVIVSIPKDALDDPQEVVKAIVKSLIQKGDRPGHEFHGNQYVQVASVPALSNRASGTRYRDTENDALYRYYRGNQGRRMDRGVARYTVSLKPTAHTQLVSSHATMMKFHEQQVEAYKEILAKGGLDAKTKAEITKAIEAHENASNAHADAGSLQSQMKSLSGRVSREDWDRATIATEASRAALKDGLAAEKLDDALAHLHVNESGESKAVVVDKKFNDPKYLNTVLPKGWTATKGPSATIVLKSAATGNVCTVKNNSATSESAWNFGHHGEAINQMISHLDEITTNVHLDMTSRKEFAGELGFVNGKEPSVIHLSGPQAFARAAQGPTTDGQQLVGEERISAVVPQKPWDMTEKFDGQPAKDVWTVDTTRTGVERTLGTINHELGHVDYFRDDRKFTDLVPVIAELSQGTRYPMSEDEVRSVFERSVGELARDVVKNGRAVMLPAYGSTSGQVTNRYSDVKQYFMDTQAHKIPLGGLETLMGDLGVTKYGRTNWHETVAEMRSAWLAKDVTPPPLARKMAETWGWDNPLKKAARLLPMVISKAQVPTDQYVLIPNLFSEAPNGVSVVWSNVGWVDPLTDTFYPNLNFDNSVLVPYAYTDAELAENAKSVSASLEEQAKGVEGQEKARMLTVANRIRSLIDVYHAKAANA